jgi:hypothetical protein
LPMTPMGAKTNTHEPHTTFALDKTVTHNALDALNKFVSHQIVRRLAMRALILIFLTLLVAGCQRDEEAYIRRTVLSVGPTKLLADAARLASEHPDRQGFPVAPSILPASFSAFAPVETRRYDRSFLVVTARWQQHRVGVLVQPLDYPEPKSVGNDRHIKLAPGIYFYSS